LTFRKSIPFHSDHYIVLFLGKCVNVYAREHFCSYYIKYTYKIDVLKNPNILKTFWIFLFDRFLIIKNRVKIKKTLNSISPGILQYTPLRYNNYIVLFLQQSSAWMLDNMEINLKENSNTILMTDIWNLTRHIIMYNIL